MVFRDNYPKGDFLLNEILKKLTLKNYNIEINVIYMREIMFPINNNENIKINFYKGPLNRKEVSKILFNTDIFIDASLMEGFGLMSLEAMSAGAVPIVSESFGIDEYAIDEENSFVIKKVLENMSKKAQEKALEFDIDKNIQRYINYFRTAKKQEVTLTNKEKEASKKWYVDEEKLFKGKEVSTNQMSKKRKIYHKILKMFPKGLKTKVKLTLKKLIDE